MIAPFFSKNPSTVQSFFEKNGAIKFSAFQNNIFLFLGSHGELFSNYPPYEIVPNNIKDVIIVDSDENRFLLWTRNKIGILIFSFKKNSADFFHQDTSIKWITESGANIQQAFEVAEGSYVLYLDNNTVFLTEVEAYGQRIQSTIVQVKNGTNIHYDDDKGTLYYIDPKTSLLMSVQIVAPDPIIPLSFYDQADSQQEQPAP